MVDKYKNKKIKKMTIEEIMEEREDYNYNIPYGEGEITIIDGVECFIR